MLSGNAMTASVVSACLYGIMCFALPTPSGKPLLQAPSPQGLMLVPDEPGCSQKSVPSACLAKTLILGQTESDLAESDEWVCSPDGAPPHNESEPQAQPSH